MSHLRLSPSLVAAGLVAVLAAGSGCERPSGIAAAPAASRPGSTAVGPVPGPPRDVARTANPYAGSPTAMRDGRTLFVRMNCSGCHGGRAGGGMGPSLRDTDWLYGSAAAQIFNTISDGRAHGMPSWGPLLNDDQIWKLVTYIKSLRTRDEPDAPSE